MSSCNNYSCKWPNEQYNKIQDFVIYNKLWKLYPDTMSHADILIHLAKKGMENEPNT